MGFLWVHNSLKFAKSSEFLIPVNVPVSSRKKTCPYSPLRNTLCTLNSDIRRVNRQRPKTFNRHLPAKGTIEIICPKSLVQMCDLLSNVSLLSSYSWISNPRAGSVDRPPCFSGTNSRKISERKKKTQNNRSYCWCGGSVHGESWLEAGQISDLSPDLGPVGMAFASSSAGGGDVIENKINLE